MTKHANLAKARRVQAQSRALRQLMLEDAARYRAAMEREAMLDRAYAQLSNDDLALHLDDESSIAHFNRYIAGDRK